MRRSFKPGDTFHRWTLVEKTDQRSDRGYVVWLCECACGTRRHVGTSMFKLGGSTSCGCYRKEQADKSNKQNLSGHRFGRLVPRHVVGVSKARNQIWECVCDCGNTAKVETRHLKSGNTVSCGCAAGTRTRIRPSRVADANIAYQAVRRSRASSGRFTEADVVRIHGLQKGCCAICHDPVSLSDAHRDHIVPLFLGGANDAGNIQILCPTCNLSKGSKHPIDFAQMRGLLL